jgi:hypothetical protein
MLSVAAIGDPVSAQSGTPTAELVASPNAVTLPGLADSNSPVVWDLVNGRNQLFVMTSVAGRPNTAAGRNLFRLGSAAPIEMDPWPGGGVWMEAVVPDVDGTWYGYFHNEVVADGVCRNTRKVMPRLGAARSRDQGRTWEFLGTILEAPPGSYSCNTKNTYFVGGIGDLSVQLSQDSRDLYIFYSEYMRGRTQQGVSVARLAWADRDEPVGKVTVWKGRLWDPGRLTVSAAGGEYWTYTAGTPLFPTRQAWHDADTAVDAFWGPSVHWNTFLNQYVMLLNRAKDEAFTQEGIYVSFAPSLEDPAAWSTPVKILEGGRWYPQVIGVRVGESDRIIGETGRFFMSGTSDFLIRFHK